MFFLPKPKNIFTRNSKYLGQQASSLMSELSLLADKNGPELIKRNCAGRNDQ